MNILKEILNQNKIIETDRLKIYPFKIIDKVFFDLFEIYKDEENVLNYSSRFDDLKDFGVYMYLKISEHQDEKNGIISYVIERKIDSKIIGVRNFILDGKYTFNGTEFINNNNLITEIIINKKYWQNGYAEEATLGLFNFIKNYQIKNILSFVKLDNIKAKRLDEKLDFKETSFEELISNYNFHPDCQIHTDTSKKNYFYLKKI